MNIMRLLYIPLFVTCLSSQSNNLENNVCPRLEDYYTIKDNPNCEYDIAADGANVVGISGYYGYAVETHTVVTPDKYILTMFRIINDNVDTNLKTGPVFLQHGLLCSALNFFGLGKDSLPFLLSDAGYDVWVGNFRGNEYSEGHLNLTVFDQKYWDYSADELGMYDMPTQLDYVAAITRKRGKIIYIGHSLGTHTALRYSSYFPKIAKRTVKLFILLGPAYKLTNIRSPAIKLVRYALGKIVRIVQEYGLMRLTSQTKILRTLMQTICFESPYLMQFCIKLLNILFIGPYSRINVKSLPVVFQQLPSGMSFKLLGSVGEALQGKFRKYDYGISENLKRYGSTNPPSYDISKIDVPIIVICAVNDYGATEADAKVLYESLPSKVKYGLFTITDPYFNHGDFLYGERAKTLLYDRILKLIEDFNNEKTEVSVYYY